MSISPAIALLCFQATLLVLSVKALFLGMATAARRGSLKTFLNKEDADWLNGSYSPIDPELVARIGRAHRNDLENLLLFAVSGMVFFQLDGPAFAGFGYSIAFLLARIAHTVAYLGGRPLLRRNAYTLGFLVVLAISIHGLAITALG